MAVAALPEVPLVEDPSAQGLPALDLPARGAAVLDLPWPRPGRFLVEVDRAAAVQRGGARRIAPRRRLASPEVRRRRRRFGLGMASAAIVAVLAAPVAGLGGRPATAPASRQPVGVGSTIYVVQPGDTLWSIAASFDRGGNPRPLAEALARETGSSTVVPGERIRIP